MFRTAVLLLWISAVPAFAMNWEGHDDWLEDAAASQAFAATLPGARPPPSPPCPVTRAEVQANPYAQIPLPRHRCGPDHRKALPGR